MWELRERGEKLIRLASFKGFPAADQVNVFSLTTSTLLGLFLKEEEKRDQANQTKLSREAGGGSLFYKLTTTLY